MSLLWQRAVFDPQFRRVFCLVHAEKLSYQIADKALHSLLYLIQNKSGIYVKCSPEDVEFLTSHMHIYTGYRLLIICSSKDEERSHIISKLRLFRRPYGVPADPAKYRVYLRSHFVDDKQPHYQQLLGMGRVPNLTASAVDLERCVHFYA